MAGAKLPTVIPVARAASAHDHQPVVIKLIGKGLRSRQGLRSRAGGPQLRKWRADNTILRMRYGYKDIRRFPGSHAECSKTPVPGPTLRVKPGDVLRIKLINDMPPNGNSRRRDHALPHDFNTTNLHSHGLHASRASPTMSSTSWSRARAATSRLPFLRPCPKQIGIASCAWLQPTCKSRTARVVTLSN